MNTSCIYRELNTNKDRVKKLLTPDAAMLTPYFSDDFTSFSYEHTYLRYLPKSNFLKSTASSKLVS